MLLFNWHFGLWCRPLKFTFSQYLHCLTFRTGGFVIKSSNGSSGLTVVKFSCKIPIFFSLSHPDGLKGRKTNYSWCNDVNSVVDNYVEYFLGIKMRICFWYVTDNKNKRKDGSWQQYYLNVSIMKPKKHDKLNKLSSLTWTLHPSPPLKPVWWTGTHKSYALNICKADPGSSPLWLTCRSGQLHLFNSVKAAIVGVMTWMVD